MPARVLVSDDLCTDRMQPFVAVGVVEVPVRVDEVRDGTAIKLSRLGDLSARRRCRRRLAPCRPDRPGPRCSTGTLEDADIVSQPVRHDGRNRGTVFDQTDKAPRLRECLEVGQPV